MTNTRKELWTPVTRAEALAAGWTHSADGCATATEAYEEWVFVDRDLRRFMQTTLRWTEERYDAEWTAVMREPGWDGAPEPIDIFYDRVGGLMPDDHEWMTLAAVLRDGVTAYEVYLTKAIDEVLRSHGKQRRRADRTPGWGELRDLYAPLGLVPMPPAVADIVDLRHVLTHRRGELRTESERHRFAKRDEPFASTVAQLTEESVVRCLDTLAANVREVDPVCWAYAWGSYRLPLLAVAT